MMNQEIKQSIEELLGISVEDLPGEVKILFQMSQLEAEKQHLLDIVFALIRKAGGKIEVLRSELERKKNVRGLYIKNKESIVEFSIDYEH